MLHHSTNRRVFLQTLATGATLPLLAACGATAPAAPAAPAAGTAPTSKPASASAYPSFIPFTGGAKPDFPSAGALYQDGFINYPKNPQKVMLATPPGAGGKVLCYTNNSAPAPPTPFEQNQAWQTVNKELNADVQYTIIAQSDYIVKLATVMAGNDLPDVMLIPGASPSGASQVQNLTPFLAAQGADLTPYLGGDAARDN